MFNGLKRGIVICACAALAVSCMDYGPIEKEDFEIDNIGSGDEVTGKGLFITNEGNFMYGFSCWLISTELITLPRPIDAIS